MDFKPERRSALNIRGHQFGNISEQTILMILVSQLKES